MNETLPLDRRLRAECPKGDREPVRIEHAHRHPGRRINRGKCLQRGLNFLGRGGRGEEPRGGSLECEPELAVLELGQRRQVKNLDFARRVGAGLLLIGDKTSRPRRRFDHVQRKLAWTDLHDRQHHASVHFHRNRNGFHLAANLFGHVAGNNFHAADERLVARFKKGDLIATRLRQRDAHVARRLDAAQRIERGLHRRRAGVLRDDNGLLRPETKLEIAVWHQRVVGGKQQRRSVARHIDIAHFLRQTRHVVASGNDGGNRVGRHIGDASIETRFGCRPGNPRKETAHGRITICLSRANADVLALRIHRGDASTGASDPGRVSAVSGRHAAEERSRHQFTDADPADAAACRALGRGG